VGKNNHVGENKHMGDRNGKDRAPRTSLQKKPRTLNDRTVSSGSNLVWFKLWHSPPA
jgi:hypothetical protein